MITLSTILNLMLFCSIGIIILNYIIDQSEIVLIVGIQPVLYIMFLLLLRLFFPIELPWYQNISITKIWPNIYAFIIKSKIELMGTPVDLIDIIVLISIVGSITCLARMLLLYYSFVKSTEKYEDVLEESILNSISQINIRYGKKKRIRIVSGKEVMSPVIFGLFNSCIIIPDMDLTEKEWNYVLQHEMAHYHNKDLWVRFICELLRAIYWWNPCIYLLYSQISKLQELRVDSNIIKQLDEIKQLEYVECLIKVSRMRTGQEKRNLVAAFTSDGESEVIKRIRTIWKYINGNISSRKNKLKGFLMILSLVVCVFVIPSFYVMEPTAMAKEDQTGNYGAEEMYYILKADGTYDLYGSGVYLGTFDSISSEPIKIYREGESIK